MFRGSYYTPLKKNGAITLDVAFHVLVKCVYVIVLVLKYMIMIVWLLYLQLPVQSVPITIKVVSSNPVHGEVNSMQHYVVTFVNFLRQARGFLRILRFPPPIKLTDITEIWLKVVLNTLTLKIQTKFEFGCCCL